MEGALGQMVQTVCAGAYLTFTRVYFPSLSVDGCLSWAGQWIGSDKF